MRFLKFMIYFVFLVVGVLTPLLSCQAVEKPDDKFESARLDMVRNQIAARGISDSTVLKALIKVPRHRFVPDEYLHLAYIDSPLPIGNEQTISQPYIVALMTELIELKASDKVLEIGTGSGYQAAILGELASEVYTIEIIEPLADLAGALLDTLGYNNIFVRAGDGYKGWPDKAPFNAIIVTCAPSDIPKPLVEQLIEGGRMVIPIGENRQELVLLKKEKGKIIQQDIIPVRFVPMTGEAENRNKDK